MNRNNGFLNFIFACIPGVGLMYNRLIKMGLSILILFMLSINLLDFIGLNDLTTVVIVPLWFYSFFKTFEVNRRILNGEFIEDKFIFVEDSNINIKADSTKVLGVVFIILGGVALLNRTLHEFLDYRMLRIIRGYLGPILFIILGVIILIFSLNKNDNRDISNEE
ncbi:hypothetical protein [Clostridium hydrogeniformans]|uniref:hypothetical protein n=1 Tax=Clostridium hydrogeniformans TaxID=349933 RepID=UPI0006901A1B|nr:hypothetical protein [Clostridium hydrogeniformans]